MLRRHRIQSLFLHGRSCGHRCQYAGTLIFLYLKTGLTWSSAQILGTDSVQCSMYLNGDLYLEQSPAPANYDLPSYLPNGYDDMFIGQKTAPGWDKWGGDAAHMAWFDRGLTLDEINYLFTGNLSVGCTDPTACNYIDTATEDSGNCDYSCCPGPGCCDEGMHWNYAVGCAKSPTPRIPTLMAAFN